MDALIQKARFGRQLALDYLVSKGDSDARPLQASGAAGRRAEPKWAPAASEAPGHDPALLAGDYAKRLREVSANIRQQVL